MPTPDQPKIYHIVHVDNLASIVTDGCLWSDSEMIQHRDGTVIGMATIKQRRLKLAVSSHPGTYVGDYVPFYFCPRSVMLYLIYCRSNDLSYKGGQEPIVHLEVDLKEAVAWADANDKRWAFTLSNAGAYYFEDRSDIDALDEINWDAVHARQWAESEVSRSIKEGKQAEFLIWEQCSWQLISEIGVINAEVKDRVEDIMNNFPDCHRPPVVVRSNWYYQSREKNND